MLDVRTQVVPKKINRGQNCPFCGKAQASTSSTTNICQLKCCVTLLHFSTPLNYMQECDDIYARTLVAIASMRADRRKEEEKEEEGEGEG